MYIALEKDKPEDMTEAKWQKINHLACGTIMHFLVVKDQKYFIMRETIISDFWQKMEDKYMTKSIENHLY